ncbi:SMP-30/gluconolactonase/LRE family protein [Agromyces subbeticus]|uniref:SMP-30/gluconolactonase/LRE family protein n=1 Tax=Agromyces subbeticus TaxID=293890 RepID=UPI0003B5D6B6|nr:SMP-30/gluconolactonase/LRE family protein [Agromyces subbeticus]
MKRIIATALAAASLTAGITTATITTGADQATAAEASAAHLNGRNQEQNQGRPDRYLLPGDAAGSRFEGIGVDERRGLFYVSEVTGGEIHRGTARDAQAEEWLAGDGTDGRFTARGITVDAAGNVYIAGGPNGIGNPDRPDLWVYSQQGELLAALRAPGTADAFLNDVAIGADGAAYFTNSNDPQIFRVAQSADGWSAELWADAAGTVDRVAGFNLGGIVLSADRSAFVVAQGNTGQLWRFATADGAVSAIDTQGADLVNADGLVRQGNELTVIRNFSKMVATMRVSADGDSVNRVTQQASDPDRVYTTAKMLHGRLLAVDSKFDEQPAPSGPYDVVGSPWS